MKDPNDFMTGKGEPAWSLPMNRSELIARVEALEAALQLRCPQCDMQLLERTAPETLVDLKDPHNAHHPDRLKGPGLTAPETLVDLKDPHNAHHPDRLKGPGLTAPETKDVKGGELTQCDGEDSYEV